MNLDELLESAAPTTAARTADLRRDLDLLVAESESAARPPSRRRWRPAVIAAAVIGVAGIGATAAASSIWRTPPAGPWDDEPVIVEQTFRLPDGTDCQADHRFEPITQPESLKGVSDARWRAALGESQAFLRRVDPASIDQRAVASRYLAEHERARQELPATERGPKATLGEAYLLGFGAELRERLDADLTAKGLPIGVVGESSSFPMDCLGWEAE